MLKIVFQDYKKLLKNNMQNYWILKSKLIKEDIKRIGMICWMILEKVNKTIDNKYYIHFIIYQR